MELYKLNFEATFDFKISKNKDTFFIYDLLRKTHLVLTPEEWVRQHWIHYFHVSQKKALSCIISERKIEIHNTTKRIDLLITHRTNPQILIECKAPQIKLNESHFEQVARYNSVIKAKTIVVSNGFQHILARFEDNEYKFQTFSFDQLN